MKLRACLLTTVWVLIAAAVVSASPVGECPPVDPVDHTDHLPDDKDCTIFYKCDHAAPVKFVCPDGLHFNRVLQVCDWPDAAGCTGGSTACQAVGTCPLYEDEHSIAVHLPHATDCTKFCKCDHGSPVEFDCPAGLHFNPTLQVCDWPSDAGCTAGGGSPPPASPSTASPTPAPAPSSTAKPPLGICPAVGTCPLYEDEDSIAVHLPHASDCTKFCKCDHGSPVEFDCPAGLHFNPTLQVCDWPSDAGCSAGGGSPPPASPSTASPTPAPAPSSTAKPPPESCPALGYCPLYEDETSIAVHLPHASDCTKFCKCDHGIPVTFDCPAGLHFNPILEVCDWPESAGCSGAPEPCNAVGSCPEYDKDSIVVHLPHSTDCGLYCRCNHGVPITEKCPDGLHFNAELEVCDWPAAAGCE